MTEWRKLTIADLAAPVDHALATGPFGSAISSKHFVEAGVPVIRGSNLSTEVGVRLKDEGLAFLTPEKADTFRRSMATRGDLVFTCWGTVGQIGYIDERARYDCYVVSNKQMKLTPDPTKVLGEFLYYAMSTEESMSQVTGQAIGSAVPGFNLGQLRDIRVLVPDLPLQQRVVDVLGSIDDLVESNRRRVEMLEEMARAIYREWFVHLRFPGYEDATYVESDTGPVPEGWSTRRTDEVAAVALGGTPARKRAEYWGGSIPWVTSSSVNDVRITQADEWITEEGLSSSSTKLIPRRSTAIAITGATLGQVSLLEIDSCTNQSIVTVTDPEGELSEFIYLQVSERIGELIANASGSAQQHINKGHVKEFSLTIPTPDLAARLRATVAPMFDLLRDLLFQTAALTELRDRLLPKLVTGQIDVSNLDLDAVVEKAAV